MKKLKSRLKPYRVHIAVDIVAENDEGAQQLAQSLYEMLQGRWWVKDVLPDGIEERRWLDE